MTRALLLWAGVLVALLSAAVPAARAVGTLLPARMIAYQRFSSARSELDTWLVDVERAIVVRAFTGVAVLAASNDGRWLAVNDAALDTTAVRDRRSGQTYPLLDTGWAATFSADSRRLLYVREHSVYGTTVFSAALPWDSAQVVTNGEINGAALSPDGGTVLLALNGSGQAFSELRRLDLSTRAVTPLTPPTFAFFPAWSPDGAWIAFVGGTSVTDTALYLMRPDGSDLRLLSREPGSQTLPVWSPDGRQIAFICVRSFDHVNMCLVNADGTGFVRMSHIRRLYPMAAPVWLP